MAHWGACTATCADAAGDDVEGSKQLPVPYGRTLDRQTACFELQQRAIVLERSCLHRAELRPAQLQAIGAARRIFVPSKLPPYAPLRPGDKISQVPFCVFRSLPRKRATNPAAADLHVGPLDRRPGDPMRRLFLVQFADMRGKGVIEGLAVDILSMWRQMGLHRSGKVTVGSIRHGCSQAGANLVHEIERQAGGRPYYERPRRQRHKSSGLLDIDFLLALLRLWRLRQRDREHAVLEVSLDLLGINAVRHAERTLERAIAAFGEVIVLLLFLLLVLFLSLYIE